MWVHTDKHSFEQDDCNDHAPGDPAASKKLPARFMVFTRFRDL